MMKSPSEEATPEDRSTARLHRSATDRVLFGVCGGIAEYLAVDPALVRVAFVVATLWGGIGLVFYAALAVILPVGDNVSFMPGRLTLERSHMLAGLHNDGDALWFPSDWKYPFRWKDDASFHIWKLQYQRRNGDCHSKSHSHSE